MQCSVWHPGDRVPCCALRAMRLLTLALGLLLVLFSLPCLRYGTLRLTPARWRPVLFVSLLERPG